ncbi:MAG: thermonuclease family protein [Magnetococcales bacterium]|nr:thermonuclease family protein [Magnetococcales bacterium]NGZ06680.1 thermonuclease family protein [Magnetococcales bacterium]
MKCISALLIVLAVWLLPYGGQAAKVAYDDMAGVVYLGNHDGDTFRVTIPGVPPLFGENISIRIRGVDTPELRGQCAQEKLLARVAKRELHHLLVRAGEITLKEVGRDKYFRIVARVEADGEDVGARLLRMGLATPYDGGHKQVPWCQASVDE